MRTLIRQALALAHTLDEAQDLLIKTLKKAKADNFQHQIGYIAGIVTSDGPEHIPANIARLEAFTQQIKQQENFPVFSSVDVFSDELFQKIRGKQLPAHSWEDFWRAVLGSGQVTDVFMTPRWQESRGATDEHTTARKLGLIIHYYSSV